jgi:transglutaminase-like putative cysteine protease
VRFSVRHRTTYVYSAPVWLGAHKLRLNPRPESGALLRRDLRIDPAPALRHDETDAFGNLITCVGFSGASARLEIESRFELETAAAAAPVLLDHSALAPYLASGPIAGPVRAFAAGLFAQCEGDAPAFLQKLNETIYRAIRHDIRDEGGARAPEETLALGYGACRDVTILFLAACRSLGFPARFVSGYQAEADTPDGKRHLHAWAEAYAPDFGWRAYDPTHLIPVAEAHVALAAAPDQAATMPVEGGYFGDPVASTLSYAVEIETG